LNDPLAFEDETFDAAYEIQALSYAKDKIKVFSEIFRVMRPGARFSYLDWVLLPPFDSSNPEHADLLKRACGLMGAVDSPPVQDVINAMEKAGFQIVLSENPSIDGQQNSMFTSEDKYFDRLRTAVEIGVRIRLLPRHFLLLVDRLMKDADAMIEVDRMGLGTTAYHIVCEKPPT
jgi:sterol 24-C-methyltransferase